MKHWRKKMKIKINNDNDNLWCLYLKERIEIGDKYIEVVEECLGETIIKTYSYEQLDDLINEYIEEYGTDPELEFRDE